eukprot:CAMPEP_0179102112 /NCGR_PEP_ID=MMETSP0796-20121207/47246_1 /TAXON_ID=73915 /ORGANISM="Pyrodinium bahamense, Strain pbaha01" /LENGTH=82 /DNA_ID=CAMNT_0020799981 /DNA_START=472 /DNA_END=721 /DNA_ORIENTATION=+
MDLAIVVAVVGLRKGSSGELVSAMLAPEARRVEDLATHLNPFHEEAVFPQTVHLSLVLGALDIVEVEPFVLRHAPQMAPNPV